MQKKKVKDYAKPKAAFDEVMAAYRAFSEVTIGTGMPLVIEEKNMVNKRALSNPSPTSPNPAKPSSIEFRCEVDLAVKSKLKGATLARFRAAYVLYDSDDSIEREMYAHKILGNRRHSIEQRIGAEFMRRKLDKGYFHVVR
jgi:hypothetical protein